MGSETEAQTPPAEPAPPTETPAPEPVAQEPIVPEQNTPAEPAAPAKSGGGKGMIIAIAVIAVVAIVVIAFMFMGGGVEGKWTIESAEIYDADGTLNQTETDSYNSDDSGQWIEFKSDGTIASGNATDTDDSGDTWEVSDGELTITSTYVDFDTNTTTGNITWNNETDTITFDYSVSGNTLTLELEMDGKTYKYTASKN
jgi:hypothetical protein